MKRSRIVRVSTAGALTLGVVVLRTPAGRRWSRHMGRVVTRTTRYERGRLKGLWYHLNGRQPDPAAEGVELADRVRSTLGPLEHRLDVPRVHVLAEGHDVLLHGDLASADQAEALVDAVSRIPGVGMVKSHLHVGFAPGDTCPSAGAKQHPQSEALARVLAAAHGGGAPAGCERAAARSVLSTFVALLPKGERHHVVHHLPADVRVLTEPLRPRFDSHRHARHARDFYSMALPNYAPDVRQAIVESVLGAVRDLVPEEAVDVAAVLPEELRQLWKTAVPL
jgi:uncharacterized protein (DUF2267 family)